MRRAEGVSMTTWTKHPAPDEEDVTYERSDGASVYFVDGLDRWLSTGPDGEDAWNESAVGGRMRAMFATPEEAMRDVAERWPAKSA
jgi:hypothetical protein